MKEYLRDLNNNSVGVGDEVQTRHARFFIGKINDSGLCSIDKTKPFSLLDEEYKMAECIRQGKNAVGCEGMTKVPGSSS